MPKISVRVDYGVGSFSVSPSGRDVAMASRKGLHILDLKEPFSPPRYLSLHSMWEVADVEWSYHPNHPSSVFSTVNQKIMVWDLMMPSTNAITNVLHAHKRAVTHIDQSKLRPDMLVSCSIDTFVHIWDLRDPQKPQISMCDFDAGGTQVKWSPADPHILASAHDNRLMVWDDRKQSIPLYQIAGHSGRINGIDFDLLHPNQILTCSTDCSLKIWNLRANDPSKPMASVTADFPLWRVKSLPNSTGAFLAPLRKGDNASHLVDLQTVKRKKQSKLDPVRTFSGHQGPILDFEICQEANGYELLSWSSDQTLKTFSIDGESLNSVNCRQNLPPLPRQDITYHTDINNTAGEITSISRRGHIRLHQAVREPKTSHIDWIAGIQVGDENGQILLPRFAHHGGEDLPMRSASLAPTEMLSKEVTATCAKFPKIRFEELDLHNGSCTVTIRGPWGREGQLVVLRVTFTFPVMYPHERVECQIEEDPSVDPALTAELHEHLATATEKLARYGKPALEFCLRKLMGESIPIETYLNEDVTTEIGFESLGGDQHLFYSSSSEDECDFPVNFDESSSDENGELDNGLDSEQRTGLESAADALLGPAQATKLDSTPLPKNCGAVWTADGRLLSFFNVVKDQELEQELPPMDKIFAGEASSSDSDDFDSDDGLNLGGVSKEQWSAAAASRLSIWWSSKAKPKSIKDMSEKLSQTAGSSRGLDNRVELRSFVHLMPNRKDLAEEYWFDMQHTAIEMADHNAEIAEKYGRHEEAHIWRLVRQYVDVTHAQNKLARIPGGFHPAATKNIFEWTGHPFSMELSNYITKYFVKTHNVQMLAGIACVISRYNRPILQRSQKAIAVESGTGELGHKILPYIPFIESQFWISKQGVCSDLRSHEPFASKSRRDIFPAWYSNSVIASPSPRFDHPSTPMYASSKLAPGSRDGSTIASRNHSGDFEMTSHLETPKRDSYFNLFFPESPSPLAGGGIGDQRSPSLQLTEHFEHQTNWDQKQQQYSFDSMRPTRFKIKVYNPVNYDRECLDLDMGVSTDMVSASQDYFAEMNHHRNVYADMLERWGLHIQRLELLKYNFTGNYPESEQKQSTKFGLENKIGIIFENKHRMPSKTWSSHRRACTLCHEPITKRYLYCQHCTHVMHQSCAMNWWASGVGDCPTGCGCNCEEYI